MISLAGRGEPLAAAIAQVPHCSGPSAVRATGLRASLRVTPLGTATRSERCSVAILSSSSALPGMNRLLTESGIAPGQYPTYVAARIVLKIGLYSPKRWAAGVHCPALVQIAEHDAITPRKVAEATAARMANSTVQIYDCGHFDPYVEPLFEQVVADQLAFLGAHVPTSVNGQR